MKLLHMNAVAIAIALSGASFADSLTLTINNADGSKVANTFTSIQEAEKYYTSRIEKEHGTDAKQYAFAMLRHWGASEFLYERCGDKRLLLYSNLLSENFPREVAESIRNRTLSSLKRHDMSCEDARSYSDSYDPFDSKWDIGASHTLSATRSSVEVAEPTEKDIEDVRSFFSSPENIEIVDEWLGAKEYTKVALGVSIVAAAGMEVLGKRCDSEIYSTKEDTFDYIKAYNAFDDVFIDSFYARALEFGFKGFDKAVEHGIEGSGPIPKEDLCRMMVFLPIHAATVSERFFGDDYILPYP